tara:strand:+ start:349 stop:891 length:543 start_codon:yes stop_codon:yes gene_type:complete
MESPSGFYRTETEISQSRPAVWQENANKASHFGGKRFLGYTKNGAEVWVSYLLDMKTGELTAKSTHELDSLRDEDAQLATARVTVPRNKTQRVATERMVQQNAKNAGGKVTQNTIAYIERLFSLVESKNPSAFVKGKPTSLLMNYLAGAIYEGDLNEDDGFMVDEAIKAANLPGGKYFLV